jgi:hypothetical protein
LRVVVAVAITQVAAAVLVDIELLMELSVQE